MRDGDELGIIFSPSCPNHVRNEVLAAENVVHELAEIGLFGLLTCDENGTVIPRQLLREHQSRVHHVKPVGMEATATLLVARKSRTILAALASKGLVMMEAVRVIVGI